MKGSIEQVIDELIETEPSIRKADVETEVKPRKKAPICKTGKFYHSARE